MVPKKMLLLFAFPYIASCSSAPHSSISIGRNSVNESGELILSEDFHPEGMRLHFNDEFDGNSLNPNNWGFDLGSLYGGWGNNELQYYTDHNHEIKDGELLIHAKKEVTEEPQFGKEGTKKFDYTSSRLVTRSKVSTTYGYVCASIALPTGTGMWPAFWMLPETRYNDLGWPTSGEIDIMEAKGRIENIASGALHYSSNGAGAHTFRAKEKDVGFIGDHHIYAVLWTEEEISWYIDGEMYQTIPKRIYNAGYHTGDDAPFNKDFHILLNLAVGGDYDGGRKPSDDFEEAHMSVDYVRIYI